MRFFGASIFRRVPIIRRGGGGRGFASERYDELMRQARHTMDDEKTLCSSYEAEDLLLSEFAVIPILLVYKRPSLLINPVGEKLEPKAD